MLVESIILVVFSSIVDGAERGAWRVRKAGWLADGLTGRGEKTWECRFSGSRIFPSRCRDRVAVAKHFGGEATERHTQTRHCAPILQFFGGVGSTVLSGL